MYAFLPRYRTRPAGGRPLLDRHGLLPPSTTPLGSGCPSASTDRYGGRRWVLSSHLVIWRLVAHPRFRRRAGLRRQRGRGPPRRRRTHPTASGDSVHRQARDGKQTFVGPARPALPEAAVDQALADRPRWGVEQALAEVRLRRGWARPSDLTCRQRTARRMIGFVSRPARSSRAQWRHVDRRVRWARLYESGGVPRVVDAEQANVGL